MEGNSLFLNRVIRRSPEWPCHYPALSTAWQNPLSLSAGRQIVAAAADPEGVRCVFFSSLGSVLDFSASWAELERAKTWWHFAIRWNFWLLGDGRSLVALRTAGYDPADRKIAGAGATVDRHCDQSFQAFLGHAEEMARHGRPALLPTPAGSTRTSRTDATHE
ncbi:hypothetical protein [Paraburkholderia sp. BCC1876]|uniref:hypothetical protein n=1 Tax=Paraburkholderia sp. BCC1876 TaxID=2676303 RepID=UPI00158F9DB9|nr:hypothetical protein [Paraburkholderia sp. BCC1876]